MNYKLIAVIALIGATYAGLTGLIGIPFLGSETAFTPEKTFVYNSTDSGGNMWVYATGENSTHWKGTLASNSSFSGMGYQKFVLNKETLQAKTTQEISRSELNSEDLEYSEQESSLALIFPPTLGQTEEQREKLTQPGTVEIESSKIEISESEYKGWDAYKYEVENEYSSSSTWYISRDRPNILLGLDEGEDVMSSLELEEVENGVNYPSE